LIYSLADHIIGPFQGSLTSLLRLNLMFEIYQARGDDFRY